MKIYFDESYPGNQEKMILGALFISDSAHRFLAENYRKIKAKYGINSELKYTKLVNKKTLSAAKDSIGLVYKNKKIIYFRACVLPYNANGLAMVPSSSLHNKRVGVYASSAKNLILSHLPPNKNAQLFMDKEERIEKTKFKLKIMKATALHGGKITSVVQINSKEISAELIQICDLLTGCVLQCLYPTNTKKGRFKKEFAKHVTSLFKILVDQKCKKVKSADGKFAVSFWKVPNYYLERLRMKQKKSRS